MNQLKCLLVLLTLLLAACNAVTADSLPTPIPITVEVTRQLLPPVTPAPPVVCTPWPEGLLIEVEPTSDARAMVTIEGLQPGETPILVYEIRGQYSGLVIEVGPISSVGTDGRFSYVQSGLRPEADGTNQWTLKVIHARGVACQEFSLS
jgi:hypothetical protein